MIWNVPELPKKNERIQSLIDAILTTYGHESAKALSDLTHLPGSAWSQGPADGGPMLNDTIRDDPTLE